MSEEIKNASTVVPWSIMTGILINGSLGFAMMIAALFCSGPIGRALEANPAYPFMAIFYNAVRSVSGAAVMSALVTVLALFATVGILASASRMFWSFSRDRGLPGWKTLQKVHQSSFPKFIHKFLTCRSRSVHAPRFRSTRSSLRQSLLVFWLL